MFSLKHLASSISVLRIIGAISLLFIEPLSVIFYVIYMLCGISDVLDGYIARKTDTVSKSGAFLDSIADLIFVIIVGIIFIPIITWEKWMLLWVGIITTIKIMTLVVGFIKYKAFAFLHTYANKATGVMLFFIPILYLVIDIKVLAFIMCSIASISAIEELIINLKSKRLDKNVNSYIKSCCKIGVQDD